MSSQKMTDYFDEMIQNNTILDATLSVYEDAFDDEQAMVRFAHAVTKAAYEHGVKIGAGVDESNDNIETTDTHKLLQELKLLKEVANMTTMDVLKAATIHNAIALGIDKEYGTVEKGKKADLIFLNQNPFDDLDNLTSVFLSLKRGMNTIFKQPICT